MKKYLLKTSKNMNRLSEEFPKLTSIDVKTTEVRFITLDRFSDSFVWDGYDNIEHKNMDFVKTLEQPFLVFTGSNWLHHATAYYVWEVYKKQKDFDIIVFDAHLDLRSAGDHALDDMIEYHNYMKPLLICVGHNVNAFNMGSAYNKGSLYKSYRFMEGETNAGFEHNYFVNMTIDNVLKGSKKKIYLSIDLDCLSDFRTDHSGGRMRSETLKRYVDHINREKEIVGMDVCGIEGMQSNREGGYYGGKRIIPEILSIIE